MKKKLRKDKNIRQNFYKFEVGQFVVSNSSNSLLLPNSVRNFLGNKFLIDFSKNSLLSKCVARCIATGRKKRLNSLFSFSRLALRRFFRHRKILHWRTSKW